MKKLIYTAIAALSLIGTMSVLGQVSPGGNSVTVVLQPNSMTNIVSVINGYAKVTQVILSANATNCSCLIIDTPTNRLSYVVSAYTNTISYVTNVTQIYTNWVGNLGSNVYSALVDITNNVVPQTTNAYPINLGLATLAGTSTKVDNQQYFFQSGIWATNTGPGVCTITVNYQQ